MQVQSERKSLDAPEAQSQPRAQSQPDGHPSLSVIVPVFNEAGSIVALAEDLIDRLRGMGYPFDLILVDDASTDATGRELRALAERFPEIRPRFLARTYGQSTAMQCGFDASDADIVVTLDGDLQNDPADIPMMVERLLKEDLDVVSGWRRNRQDPPLRKALSRVANRIIARLTGVRLHDFGCSLKVYRRELLSRTRIYGEMHRFLPALLGEVGARVAESEVKHKPRIHGRSKYSLDRTFRVLLDMVFVVFLRKYLQRPLHFFGGAGLHCLIPGSVGLGYLVMLKLFAGEDIGTRPLLILSALLIRVGVILICQGLVGEVISRILFEAGKRPQYYLKRE